jgi:hypothetical protein
MALFLKFAELSSSAKNLNSAITYFDPQQPAMRITLPRLGGRSKWKGISPIAKTVSDPFIGPHIVNFQINLAQALAHKVPIRTQARSCTILPEFIGYRTSFLYLTLAKICHED